MKYRIPKLALRDVIAIYWFDAHQSPDVYGASKDLLDSEYKLCDVGFYIGQSRQYLVIATEADADSKDNFRHIHYIPKVNVIRIDKLGRA